MTRLAYRTIPRETGLSAVDRGTGRVVFPAVLHGVLALLGTSEGAEPLAEGVGGRLLLGSGLGDGLLAGSEHLFIFQ